MRDALGREEINRSTLEAVAQKHQVCPFELSLDVSTWSDAVICDYNYVFDPKVYLRRHFAEGGGQYGFLVDEAFLVGYGLGAVEQTNRNLPYLAAPNPRAPVT